MKHGLFTKDAILSFEAWVTGSRCWPRRLIFMIAKWKSSWSCSWSYYLPSVHTFMARYSDLFLSFVPVWGNVKFIYLLNSFNKETLLLLLLLFDSRISGVIMTCKDCNQLHWTEVESFEIIWHQIRAKLGIFVNPVGYSEGFEEKMGNSNGREVDNFGIPRAWRETHFGNSEDHGGRDKIWKPSMIWRRYFLEFPIPSVSLFSIDCVGIKMLYLYTSSA